jgi:hypothetical protein
MVVLIQWQSLYRSENNESTSCGTHTNPHRCPCDSASGWKESRYLSCTFLFASLLWWLNKYIHPGLKFKPSMLKCRCHFKCEDSWSILMFSLCDRLYPSSLSSSGCILCFNWIVCSYNTSFPSHALGIK